MDDKHISWQQLALDIWWFGFRIEKGFTAWWFQTWLDYDFHFIYGME